ncbi:hypothetical protein HDU76_011775, partial [Blyttiomyces sp. JEL0837]
PAPGCRRFSEEAGKKERIEILLEQVLTSRESPAMDTVPLSTTRLSAQSHVPSPSRPPTIIGSHQERASVSAPGTPRPNTYPSHIVEFHSGPVITKQAAPVPAKPIAPDTASIGMASGGIPSLRRSQSLRGVGGQSKGSLGIGLGNSAGGKAGSKDDDGGSVSPHGGRSASVGRSFGLRLKRSIDAFRNVVKHPMDWIKRKPSDDHLNHGTGAGAATTSSNQQTSPFVVAHVEPASTSGPGHHHKTPKRPPSPHPSDPGSPTSQEDIIRSDHVVHSGGEVGGKPGTVCRPQEPGSHRESSKQ